MLVIMIVTGIVLAMHYTPNADARLRLGRAHHARRQLWLAAALHPYERRVDVLLDRLYPHVPRALLRLLQVRRANCLWMLGVVILLLMMATAFMGYVLPWGQMSYWARHRHHQPVLGDPGRRQQDRDAAVGRLHRRQPDAEPLLLAALPAALRDRRSGRAASARAAPLRLEQPARHRPRGRRTRSRSIPTTRSRTCSGWRVFLLVFAFFIFYAPNFLGTRTTTSRRTRWQTPNHIVPEWYFLPYLRDPALGSRTSCSASSLMFGSIFCCSWCRGSTPRRCAAPAFGRSTMARSGCCSIDVIALGWVGASPPEGWSSSSGRSRPSTTSSTSWCCCR